ncbi:MAG: hypothetical protein WCG51_01665 [Elusimicrobiota bacterium]
MKREYTPLIILILAILVFLSPVLFTSSTYFLRDLTYIFHPWRTFTAELVQRGEMPLWNPYIHCGMPLLANWQSAVFYPLSLPFYFFSFVTGLKLFQVGHLLIAGIFAYLWGRSVPLNRWASAGVMIVWVFNGYMITRLEFLSHYGVDVWLFAALLLSRNPLLLALSLAIAFFAGHYIIGLVAAVAIIYRTLHNPVWLRATMKYWLIFCTVFFSIIACQFLPTIGLILQTSRFKEGYSIAIAMAYSVTFSDIVHLINPFLSTSSIPAIVGEKFSWATSFHIGFCAFLCGILGFVRSKMTTLKVFSGILFLAGILLALGNHSFFYPWLYRTVPIISTIRYPTQFLLLTIIGSAIVTGLGLQQLRRAKFFVVVILIELIVVSWNFQITAPHAYFYSSSPLVKYLQEHSNQGTNRFILSPGTETDRNFVGTTAQDAWQSARGMLYNLSCMPYHIANAYGSGEPLTNNLLETSIDTAYRASSATEAMPLYRRLGIRYLVCKNILPPRTGYIPIMPHLYELPGPTATENYQIYRPPSFRAGAAITIMMLIMLSFIAFRFLTRSKIT